MDNPPGNSFQPVRVEDVMGPAVAVWENASLRDVARVMLEKPVQAVVVVNAAGDIRGVITDRQLTLSGATLRLASINVPKLHGSWVTPQKELEASWVASATLTAQDVMETKLSSTSADEPVGAVVARMVEREAEYAVVRRQGFLVGMLTRHELLCMMAGGTELKVVPIRPPKAEASSNQTPPPTSGGWRWPHRGWLLRAIK